MKTTIQSSLFSILLPVLAVVFSTVGSADEKKTVVQSVNYPLHYFAVRLATDAFALNYLVDADEDPAFWKPGDEALLAFRQADLILRNGADYEKWMRRVSLPASKMLDTSKAFADKFLKTQGKEHRHGDGTVHSHAGTAFTTWIDFSQAALQAEAIAARFQAMQPESAAKIGENLTALKADLDSLDGALKSFGEAWGGRPLAASHPIYHYFARAYGLKIEALEWEPEMEIGIDEIADLKKMLSVHPAEWMIWEDEPTEENIAVIAALGMKSVVFAPCANVPEEGDWLSVMRQNVENLQALLKFSE